MQAYLNRSGNSILLSITLFIVIFCSSLFALVDFSLTEERLEDELVEISSEFSYSSASPGKSYDAAVILEIANHWHINSIKPKQDFLIPAKLEFGALSELQISTPGFPTAKEILLLGETMSVYDGKVVIRFKIDISSDTKSGDYTLPVSFTYQACNDKECRAPKTIKDDLIIAVGVEGEIINADLFGSNNDIKQQTEIEPVTEPLPTQENDLQRLINDHGFWGYFLALGIAFITGLLLSFSPCTYPMIPITVSIFAGQQRSIGKGFILSLFYVGSMAVVYGVMGLIVSLVGGVFGSWLASTPVVIGIVVVFVIFALSMFGLYEIQVPMWLRNKLGGKASGGGVAGAILLGIVAALVVSPCVGPFVAGILLYVATSGSPVVGFLVLFVFAIGLGTLFLIIGTFSSAINKLPGSGGWMESVKKFFGFVLILMAIYFLRTIIPLEVTAILTGFLLLSFAVFGGGLDRLTSDAGFFLRLKKFLGVIALLLGIYLIAGVILMQGFVLPPAQQWLPAIGGSSVNINKAHIPWKTDLEQGLADALKENKPVLIDTWATWCVNCKVLEKKTFGNEDVIQQAERFVPLKVQLENAKTDITKNFMARFGLKHYSLPTTLLIDSQGKVRRIIQGVIGPEEMIAEMNKIN